jgi:hypothetical protein|tara:strand:+ start:141 stop:431 length:291 start_codon:yes stop_codon:yes gene_type:complete
MDAEKFLNDRADHHIRYLFKAFLGIMEDLKNNHEVNFEKLYDNIPEEHHSLLEMGDYFDEKYYNLYRKKVLDIGNSVLREYNNELENLTVEFKFNK